MTARRLTVGLAAALVTALVIGIPTGIIQTDFYHRMTRCCGGTIQYG